ncbi:MAG: T9SS type A sorting domain-containing protein, partial [Sphingobacteriales bacterium]
VTFSATATNGGTAPVYQWKKNGSNAGTNSSNYTDALLSSGDVISCVMTSNAGCTGTATAQSNNLTITITPQVIASVSITASQTAVCSGSPVTFTATTVNAGTSPVYQWKKNGNPVGSNTNTYTDAGLAGTDAITCSLVSNAVCVSTSTVSSNSIGINVTPSVTAAVTITATQTSICPATPVTFTAAALNEGSAPNYQWKKNNLNVGTNNSAYTDAALANNDLITCVLTSNAACVAIPAVSSAAIAITVNPVLVPVISIAAADTTLCGASALGSLTASATNGGTAPQYQWKKNGSNVGANTATYLDPAIVDGDVITCTLVSNATCANTAAVSSNAITFAVHPQYTVSLADTICAGDAYILGTQTLTASGMYTEVWPTTTGCDSTVHLDLKVNETVTPAISIVANPGAAVSAGQVVSFTATITHGGTSPLITWKKNNVAISGATGTTWQGTAGIQFAHGDNISAELVSDAPCVTLESAGSNVINMAVQAVGITERDIPENFKLFPNPSTGAVSVYAPGKGGSVQVRDVLGRVLKEKQYESDRIFTVDLSHIASGAYTLLFQDRSGKRWSVTVIKD